MFKAFYRMSIIHQTAIILFSLTLLVFTCFTSFVAWDMNRNLLDESRQHMQKQTALISSMFQFYDNTLRHDTERLGKIFFSMFPGEFELSEFESTQIAGHTAPVLTHNGRPLNLDYEEVDQFTSMTDGAATVFVRDGDDFLRITTTLKKENGERAIGTYLGKTHPGYKGFMQGKEYFGRAHLFGRDYMTKYIPIQSSYGEIIAILFIGFDYSSGFGSLRNTVNNTRIGETGLAYAIDNTEKNRGQLVIHPKMKGTMLSSLFSSKDQDNSNRVFSEHEGSMIYQPSPLSGNNDKRLVSWQKVDGWNWIIATEASVNELSSASREIRNKLILLSLLACGLMTIMIFSILKRQLKPLKDFMPKLRLIGNGDLTQKLDIQGYKIAASQSDSNNEIRALGAHINEMVDRFRVLVDGVLNAVTEVSKSTSSLEQIAKTNSDGLILQQRETEVLVSAINEMAASVEEVANSAMQASEETRRTDSLADQGKKTMASSMETIRIVAIEIDNASELVNSIKDESEAIGTVLDVIRGIAEQTNLLALNAAIEAARAGEQGRGFAVVADEVRTLAQRSQESTTEIQDIIERLQHGVEQAVTTMNSDSKKSEESVNQANEAARALAEITESVSKINTMNAQVAVATEEQSKVANEINQNIINIKEVSESSALNSENTLNAVEDLNSLSVQLQEQVKNFKI